MNLVIGMIFDLKHLSMLQNIALHFDAGAIHKSCSTNFANRIITFTLHNVLSGYISRM